MVDFKTIIEIPKGLSVHAIVEVSNFNRIYFRFGAEIYRERDAREVSKSNE